MAENLNPTPTPASSSQTGTQRSTQQLSQEERERREREEEEEEEKPIQHRQRSTKGKATILASTQDGVLQPDSMRGSEEHLKDLDVEDQEEVRREEQRKLSEKKAS